MVGTVGSWNDAQVVVETLDGERSVLVQGGTNPHYLPSGHLTYAHNGRIMIAPFDRARGAVLTAGVPLFDNVVQSSDGAAQFAVSASGDAVYVEGAVESGRRRLISVGRDGSTIPLAAPPAGYTSPRVSPDGHTLLVVMEGASSDLWTYDIRTGSATQLTFGGDAASPAWSADGQRIAFTSTRAGPPNVFTVRLDGTGVAERVAASSNAQLSPSWGVQDTLLAFAERHPARGRDVLLVPMPGRQAPTPLLASDADESAARISPDGHWLAYVSNETGRSEVYVRKLTDSGRGTRVSTDGGGEPVWARTGRELFYRVADAMMVVTTDARGATSPPRTVFTGAFARGTSDSANYDVTPDGQRFVMIERPSLPSADWTLHVLMDWLGRTGQSAP